MSSPERPKQNKDVKETPEAALERLIDEKAKYIEKVRQALDLFEKRLAAHEKAGAKGSESALRDLKKIIPAFEDMLIAATETYEALLRVQEQERNKKRLQ